MYCKHSQTVIVIPHWSRKGRLGPRWFRGILS